MGRVKTRILGTGMGNYPKNLAGTSVGMDILVPPYPQSIYLFILIILLYNNYIITCVNQF
jgi:hypothetical protein